MRGYRPPDGHRGFRSGGSGGGVPAGVTSINGAAGAATVAAADNGIEVGGAAPAVTVGQRVAAEWPIATVRYYAVDGANGSDLAVGFSDVSSAAAGLVAKKTLAGLGAILPRIGNGRIVVIRIAAGTYVGGLDAFLAGVSGYAGGFPLVLPTVTDATSGSVAFAGTTADKIQAGFVTATGMNAAGYNPVAAFSQTALKCLKVGGAAPGFPAEATGPVPMGWRIRFSATTTTAALRNITAPIIGISAADTLTLPAVVTGALGLPAVPVGTDVFYIEMAGVSVGQTILGGNWTNSQTQAARDFGPVQIVGIDIAVAANFRSAPYRLVGCSSPFMTSNGPTWFDAIYNDEAGTARQVGCFVRTTNIGNQYAAIGMNSNTQNTGGVVTGPINITNATAFNWCNGGFSTQGINVFDCKGDLTNDPAVAQPASMIGGRTANGMSGVRVRGVSQGPTGASAGLNVNFSTISLGRIDFQTMGANPAIRLLGLSGLAVSNQVTGATGNNDVGLDMTAAAGSAILIKSAPTLTGALGDVRFPDGTIHTWAALVAAGLTVDTRGNQYIAT